MHYFHGNFKINVSVCTGMCFYTWQQVLQQAQYFQQHSSRSANSNKRNKRRGSNHRRLAGGQSTAWSKGKEWLETQVLSSYKVDPANSSSCSHACSISSEDPHERYFIIR